MTFKKNCKWAVSFAVFGIPSIFNEENLYLLIMKNSYTVKLGYNEQIGTDQMCSL